MPTVDVATTVVSQSAADSPATPRSPRHTWSPDELAEGLCHDLRNPLDGAARFLRMARQALAEGRTEQADELLAGAAMGLERIKDIMAEFDGFGDAGRYRTRRQFVDAVLDECLRAWHDRICAARVLVITDMVRPLPAVEAGNLFQAFGNVIQNAVQAMPDGGRLTITGRVEPPPTGPAGGITDIHAAVPVQKPDEVVLRFSDEGIGFSPQAAQALFEPHYSTKSQAASKGLGLSICREIIERAGGRITAEPGPRGGATVTLRLPVAPDD